jgi:hypothetical protein
MRGKELRMRATVHPEGRKTRIILIALLSLLLTALNSCSQRLRGNPASAQPLSVGFWVWAGGAINAIAPNTLPLDVLYVQVGRVDSYFKNSGSWPWQTNIPPAKEFWAVWRYDPPARPADSQINIMADDFIKRRAEAAGRGQKLIGLQLDYDCPTDDLAEYGSFIEKLNKALPQGTKVSITALLDWFRSGAKIRNVLSHTSEFVPQFYDVAHSGDVMRSIAEPINAAHWGPIFNSFGIPYRIGITVFGRIVYIHNGSAEGSRDLGPLDVLGQPGLKNISAGQTPAGEQRFVMRVERPTKLNYYTRAGDQIEMILPTRNSVLAAYNSVKQMGGNCTGVLFFRWPTAEESLVLNPAQVLSWLSNKEIRPGPPTLEVRDGNCAAASCSDIQLHNPVRFSERSVVFRIRSSRPLEYFLPNPRIKSRIAITGVSSMRLELPPFHGTGSLRLGRAVTLNAAQFTIEQEK